MFASADTRDHIPGRVLWLDCAKGLGIILVVLGHTIRGLRVEEVGPALEYYRALDGWIYSFHMPLFFFISGFLFKGRAQQSWTRFGRSIAISIVWPYVLWSVAFVSIQALSPYRVNNPLEMQKLLYIWQQPISYLWFLYTLFFVQIGFFLVRKTFGKLGLGAIGVIFLVLYFTLHNFADSFAPGLTMGSALFFLGLLFNQAAPSNIVWKQPFALTLCSAAAWVSTFLIAQRWDGAGAYLSTLAAVFGVLMTLSLCRLLPLAASTGILARIGEASLAIYVSHTIFSAATRLVLSDARLLNPHLHVIAGTIMGVVLPMFLYYMCERFGTLALFGFGRNPNHASGPRGLGSVCARVDRLP